MHTPEQSQLGKTAAYADQYDPSLLFPLPRQPKVPRLLPNRRGTFDFDLTPQQPGTHSLWRPGRFPSAPT